MAVFRFGKKKGGNPDAGDRAEETGGAASIGRPQPNPRKAQRFFEYAATVADSRNHDYAIDRYIQGLRYDPESLPHHESLLEVALRRRVSGGKPASFQDRRKYSGGKTSFDKLLNTEFLWAKDPVNANLAVSVMKYAARCRLHEVAYWVGDRALEANRVSKKPSNRIKLEIRDWYAEIGAYERAIELCQAVLADEPGNMKLRTRLKQLEADLTRASARRGAEAGGETADPARSRMEEEDEEDEEDLFDPGDPAEEQELRQLRAEFNDDPEDAERLGDLVRGLLRTERDEAVEEAIRLLREAHERTGEYRLRMQAGDARMKQYNRRLRGLRERIAETDDDALRQRLMDKRLKMAQEQVRFELREYTDRVEHDPADMTSRYQRGRREFALADFDAAIASFQEAQADPKHRAWSLRYLGESFARKQWFDEAVDTLQRAMDVHAHSHDRLAIEIRYHLMKALEQKARANSDLASAREAADAARQVARVDDDYRDLRSHTEGIAALVEELSSASRS